MARGTRKKKAEKAEAAATEAVEEQTAPEERIAELESECEELRTKVMRAQADYQNLRRRNQSEYELGLKRALHPLLEDLLLVADYLDMALSVEPSTDEAKNLAVGVEMTRTKLLQALANAEVHPISTEGPFDPELHEATATEEREDVEDGSILRVVRKGYTWRENVLRHAHVVVSKKPGGERTEEQPEEADEPPSADEPAEAQAPSPEPAETEEA